MPIIPLLKQPSIADAWHEVTSPGGYEWWYFDAENTDEKDGLRMVAIFFQGFVFHPGYLRAYGKYRRRPTRTSPPLPEQYPCVYFVLYRGEKIVAQFMSEFPGSAFSASSEKVEVSIGGNRLSTAEDGSLDVRLAGVPWQLTARGPQVLETMKLSASFRSCPRSPMRRCSAGFSRVTGARPITIG